MKTTLTREEVEAGVNSNVEELLQIWEELYRDVFNEALELFYEDDKATAAECRTWFKKHGFANIYANCFIYRYSENYEKQVDCFYGK